MQISKSDYMLFLKHPAWLWLKKHAKHILPPVDDALQARFDEGHAFEPYVETLFPGLVRLDFQDFAGYQTLPQRTIDAWQNGATAVAQGRYSSGRTTCISDIVSRHGDGFVLTEIKSSTSDKPEHVFDLAFQRVVLKGAGYPVIRCEVARVNRDYVRVGDIDPEKLVSITDVTEAVSDRLDATRKWMEQAVKAAASNTMPDPAPELAKLNSYSEWMGIREKLDPPLSDDSIYRLPSMNAEKAASLIQSGVTTIDEITGPSGLNKATRSFLSAKSQGVRHVDKPALQQFIKEIGYPLFYFDYETTQSLLPVWDGTRPYQQVPFQYSLHVQREPGGEVEHREYLHRNESNPMPALLERLREDLGSDGSILVWYEGFEKARNREMAGVFPENADFLLDLNERIIDLMKPFSDGAITDPAFKGSASIKAVLPALLPELSYEDLNIREGSSASRLWKNVTLTNPESAEREKVYADLVAYCTRDTWAMVAICAKLREML